MNDRPFCSVIIPAFNEEKDIETCLISLTNQTYPKDRFEIIVVDNGSTDKTKEIAATYADLVLDKPEGNVGAVRNFGITHASGEIIICTDADCVVPPNWIETGVDLLQSNPKHAFGGGLKPRKNAKWVEKYWILNASGCKTQQHALAGSSIFMWKIDFLRLGAFNENVTSGEDSALHAQALANGLEITISSGLSVTHSGCPETTIDFVKRQIWHSENYLYDFRNSLKDKVFWLTVIYLFLTISAVFYLLTAEYILMIFAIVSTQALAMILSLKRIKRSSWSVKNLDEFQKILILDNLYLIGRSTGLLKGLGRLIGRL
ncbi:glycosyltransferase [Marinobacter xiaoshiensis]|uniref:Glycosyltransferase n=1 Tax=Marinobacter xiaoshiensis TaxID=3073652 RepID=A0ABU2HFT1_9GAMM|nr:glycosyltransferase [Marinobacter sp. F60267]MDS1309934.1 glycosyltransferase [Marinobacter sp. F60267]